MTFRVFAVQPSSAIELLGTFATQLEAERAVTSPGFHVVDGGNDLVMVHRRTDARVERVIQVALEKRRHPAFGAAAKPAPVQRLPTQRTRGPAPEQIEVHGVARTRDEWAAELGVDVSAIYQSARMRDLSFAEDVARRLSLKAIKDAAARARAERSKPAETVEQAVVEEAPRERSTQTHFGASYAYSIQTPRKREDRDAKPLRAVEASPTAQEPTLVAPVATTDDKTWHTAREVRILSAVLEHGGVEQLLNDATLGKHVRELAQAEKQ